MNGPLDVFYDDTYGAAPVTFDTTHKAGRLVAELAARPISGVTLVSPDPVGRADLVRIHDESYVDAVLTGDPLWPATSAGLGWDPDLVRGVLASTGGCIAAARAAWRDGASGSLSSGLHHAHTDHGSGFCTFNGLALAALTFLDVGAERVLILDLDAHCGGGTHEILGADPRVLGVDVATDRFDSYPAGEAVGRWVLDHVDDADAYLPTIRGRLDALTPGSVDAIVYNAGMDPHEDCQIGGLRGITDQILARREQLVFRFAADRGLPIAFVLAGGYTSDRMPAERLTGLHRTTVEACAALVSGTGRSRPGPTSPGTVSAPSRPAATRGRRAGRPRRRTSPSSA